jgi:N,N'-diacetyllegionaminate synthase
MRPLRTYIVAEAGVNHNGNLDLGKELVSIAAKCGCDAIKFQTFCAERVVSISAPKCDYQVETTGSKESQLDMIRKLELDEAAHMKLMRAAKDEGIDFISTPFDEESATLLANLGVKYIKLPSGEITNLPFLAHVARLRKPIILSTGMAYLSEVDEAVRTIQDVWRDTLPSGPVDQLILMHCLTQYPAPVDQVNLMAMVTLAEAFKLPVGYSDHTPGTEVAIAAVALGATVIEKHFTIDRTLPGPDHRASLEPNELEHLVNGIRHIEAALGDGLKVPSPSELKNRNLVRKSLVATKDLKMGDQLMPDDLTAKRPGNGISPKHKALITGSVLRKDINRDRALSWKHFLKQGG